MDNGGGVKYLEELNKKYDIDKNEFIDNRTSRLAEKSALRTIKTQEFQEKFIKRNDFWNNLDEENEEKVKEVKTKDVKENVIVEEVRAEVDKENEVTEKANIEANDDNKVVEVAKVENNEGNKVESPKPEETVVRGGFVERLNREKSRNKEIGITTF